MGLAKIQVLAKLAKCWVANHYVWLNKDVTPKKVAIYLENVLRFVDLDAEISIDGDSDICIKQKSENA